MKNTLLVSYLNFPKNTILDLREISQIIVGRQYIVADIYTKTVEVSSNLFCQLALSRKEG